MRIWKYVVVMTALGLLLVTPTVANAQGTVTGRIVQSGTQRPVPGAQVSVAGSPLGAVANNAGQYVIPDVPAGSVTLRVQFIGYATQERNVMVTAGGSVVANFELATEALGLDEIVVTGTAGGMQRRAVGNVVGSLDVGTALERSAPASLQQLLAGHISGVNVQVGGGNVGSGGNIVIRGMSTEALNSHPLVYVDGVRVSGGGAGGVGGQVSRLNDFTAQDIERIEIIKGPAAATLYGTEATNGVIQIITKKGKPGGTTLELTVRQGANWFQNAAGRIPDNYWLAPDGRIVRQNLILDEQAAGRQLFRTGHIQFYGLSVRGGQDKFSYFLSGNHEDEQGYMPNNGLKRTSLRTNLQLAVTTEVDVSAHVGVVRSDGEFGLDGGGTSIMGLILWGSPASKDTPLRGFRQGPPEIMDDIENREKLNRATASVTVAHRPAAWLSQRLTVGTDFSDADRSAFTPRLPEGSPAFYGANSVGNKQLTHLRDLHQTADYNATVSFDLTPALSSATSAGLQYFVRQSLTAAATGTSMPTPAVSTVSAAAVRSGTEEFEENRTFGVFAQQTVGWQSQAFVTAALRADANSAFGESFKAAYYPKLSGSWVVSDADFFDISFIESMKLRAAWGSSGAIRTKRRVREPGSGAGAPMGRG